MATARQPRISNEQINKIYAGSRLNEAGFVMPAPHCHPYFELFYVDSGACSFFVGNNMYDMSEGDFMLIPPNVFHYTRYERCACRRSNVFFRAEDVDGNVAAALPGEGEFFDRQRIFQVPEAFRGQIIALLSRMLKEDRIDDMQAAIMLRLQLNELFLLCSRECKFLDDLPADIHTTYGPIVRAAQFMSDRYMDDISMADIAAAAGYSPNYLSKKFREATGTGVHEYLVFTRLQHAALELLSTDHTITEIAARCGFSDGNYFKDAFKKKYGVTPREYRRSE